MRFVIQRVKEAAVTIVETEDGKPSGAVSGRIGKGFMVLIGICEEDTEQIADRMVDKMCKLRFFEDENGKTNLSLGAVGGSLLLVSQFTLYADCRKGNRPSFVKAGSPDHANALYEYIISRCREKTEDVQTGSFGALMDVSLVNDGPFTVILDSKELFDA